MKKRILSFLLALLMVMSMFPASAFATDSHDGTEPPTEAPTENPVVLAELDDACCSMYNGIHDATCENYICPNCGTGPWHEVCPETEEPPTEAPTEPAKHPMIGKLVAATSSAGNYYEAPGENMHFVNNIFFADRMEIIAVEEKSGTTYYQLKASGCNWKADSLGNVLLYDGIWMKASYVVLLVYCEVCKDYNCGIDHVWCETCEKYDCGTDHSKDKCDKCDNPECDGTGHVWCETCEKYDCGTDHSKPEDNCDKCDDPECDGTGHVWCETCEKYDCGFDHSETEDSCDKCDDPECDGTKHVECEICGKYDCTDLHFWCDHCDTYDCGKSHLVCRACEGEVVDCTKTHKWCGLCGTYDCGESHEPNVPATAPILPSGRPALLPGEAVTVVDQYGDALTDGLYLMEGEKVSISAWANGDGNAAYQWQIRYDSGSDLWVKITGQTQKGMLVSAAMFKSIIRTQGSATIRCAMTIGEETLLSDEIPVYIIEAPSAAMFGARNGAISLADEDDETGANLKTSYVVVQYVYYDGRTAASSEFASVIPGSAVNYSYTVPVIPGYKAVLKDASTVGSHATLANGVLTVTYAEGELQPDQYAQIVVEYQPDYVSYTIIHYHQNVSNDNYTEVEREVVTVATDPDRAHKTGELITNAHKSYTGFYNLLYETPAAAADGSTVIEVYYDRYYYLMKFELGGGYGLDPVYARYEAPIPEGTATRPGYTLTHWTLDGNPSRIPAYMPAGNQTYVAVWTPDGEVNYTIVYWKENANDNNYSYWTQEIDTAVPGTKISGTNSVGPLVSDEQYFTYNERLTDKDVEIKGDGSTVINVYYNRNYYTVHFTGISGTCVREEHTHGTNCTSELICGTNGHTHTAECKRTLFCTTPVHVHTADCAPVCGKEVHTSHTDACIQCGLPIHATHTNDCLICKKTEHTHNEACCTLDAHTHTPSNCCSIPIHSRHNGDCCTKEEHEHEYDSRRWNNNSWIYTGGCYPESGGRNPVCGKDEHQHGNNSGCTCELEIHTRHSTNYNNNNYGCNKEKCGLEEHRHGSSCVYCSKNLEEHKHSEDNNCFSDVIHTSHTDECYDDLHTHSNSCYDHATHSHIENCYTYQCGVTPHEHDSGCYRACTKMEHKHSNTCKKNDDDNVIYVITAKYEQDISSVWPTADKFPDVDLRGWKVGSSSTTQTSKVLTMTPNLCDATGDKITNCTAVTNSESLDHLYYLFESFDQTSPANGNNRKLLDGVYYDKSTTYSQDVNSGGGSWNAKDITGLNEVTVDVVTVSTKPAERNVFLYYTRNRWDLKFHNVSEVVKTEADIMFEQPMANYKDDGNKLLSAYVPDYPTDSYEPDTMEFAGWYTTPECYEGTQVDWDDFTMPNSDVTLYAKWVPVSRTIRFFLDKEDMEQEITIPERMAQIYADSNDGAVNPDNPYVKFTTRTDVPNKSYIADPGQPGVSVGYEDHPYNGYTFLGWFYMDDGEERAFDPAEMFVSHDLDLYAKWTSDVMCKYNVYFALDMVNNETGAAGSDGIADLDENGNVIYVAAPVTGSGIAAHTYTFYAKGGEELYNLGEDQNYQEGYFPAVGSHSITIKASDTEGTDENSFIFLYRQRDAVPYTVKYLEKGTDKVLYAEKYVSDNRNVVVTENFVYIKGYMPDEYQKTLVVTDDGNANNDVIIFYYTKDEVHALYVVNYYIQTLDANLNHAGWIKYTSLQSQGNIGTYYSADSITIGGFTLSKSYTDDYNVTQKKNGMEGTSLPAEVGALTDGKLTGKLTDQGMELNFYYTRNLYPYEFRYMLNGTTTELASPTFGKAAFDTNVTGVAKVIVKDLDGDGVYEDYRLYDPTEVTKDIHIKVDGAALDKDAVVTKGQAKVNVATFYYVRCTQTMTITKRVVDNSNEIDPDPDQEFVMSLLIHTKDGYHRTSYDYSKSDGTTGTISYEITAPNTLRFTLKAGQTITIEGLPTAEYTLTELSVPVGYRAVYNVTQQNGRYKLTVDAPVHAVVTNTFDPANLTITKTVNVVEDGNIPEVEDFRFTVTVPAGVTGNYDYTIGDTTASAAVTDGKMTVSLKKGEAVTFWNLPVGDYTVTEADYSAEGYDSNYMVTGDAAYTEGSEAPVTLQQGSTKTVAFMNKFPVGDLVIEKTVTKEFYSTQWNGDTFTFTVKRTSRNLIAGNTYNLELDGTANGTATVLDDNTIQVTITFGESDSTVLDTEGKSVHALTIKNLPAGTYSVTETENEAYRQAAVGSDNLTVSGLVIPAEETIAQFTNQLIRKTGNLYLEKELVAAPGFNPGELPVGTRFSFTVTLLEDAPSENLTFEVTCKDQNGTATSTNVTMSQGQFTVELEADQSVTVSGLPEGKYRITEATIPSYANSFAHKVNGHWVEQDNQTTSDGQMYTEIDVPADETAEVKCTNTYPVDRAELIIQKLVTKEYERDILPEDRFVFTVTLAEEDTGISSYDYTIYEADGTADSSGDVSVTNRAFKITLDAGQYAVISDLPVSGYTVSENVNTDDYSAQYEVYVVETGESASTVVDTTGTVDASGTGATLSRTLSAGKTDTVVFTNEYKRHLGTLTITKSVKGTTAGDTFIFHIKGKDANNAYIDMDVTIKGSGSITIYDLPLGNYSVTEDTSWSWRYTTAASSNSVNLNEDHDAAVTFTNTYTENRWLDYSATMPNVFGRKENK